MFPLHACLTSWYDTGTYIQTQNTQTHTDIHTCTHAYIHKQTHTATATYIHKYTRIQTYRHTDTPVQRHTDTHTHIHTDRQTYRHTNTYTHRHTNLETICKKTFRTTVVLNCHINSVYFLRFLGYLMWTRVLYFLGTAYFTTLQNVFAFAPTSFERANWNLNQGVCIWLSRNVFYLFCEIFVYVCFVFVVVVLVGVILSIITKYFIIILLNLNLPNLVWSWFWNVNKLFHHTFCLILIFYTIKM